MKLKEYPNERKCPFCDAILVIEAVRPNTSHFDDKYFISEDNHDISCPVGAGWYETEYDLLKAWRGK